MFKYLLIPITSIFAIFLVFVIYSANTGQTDYFFFKWLLKYDVGDKVGHVFLLGTMTFLLNLSLKNKKINLKNIPFLLGSCIIFTLITLEESSQFFIPNRTFDFADLFSNYLGIFIFGKLAIFLGNKIWKTNA